MDQGQLMQIKLSRFDAQPWGFRLQGGVDFAAPLLVQKVNAGSLAEQAGLLPGDAVLKINDVDVFSLRHKEAQDIVVRSGNNFVITVQRGGSTWRPQVTPTGHLPQPNQNSPYLQTVTKTSLAHRPQEVHHIGSGYNNSARPFANGGDGSVKSIVNKQYNTPVGIYSDESIAETLSAQAEVLAGGVLGVNFKKNEKEYQAEKSEVLKFLREEETSGDHTPAFNNHQYQEPQHQQQQQQHYHQQQQQHQHQQQQQHQHHHQSQTHHHQQQQQHQQQSATRHVSAPINSPKPPSTGGLPTGQNICTECERLITGVFVRIKDKNLHVECFKCATCGTSLKNQGYYNFNNKLYCDIHAKLAAMQNPPPGTEGYVPVPIKPNTKLSASTISSALNAHGFSNGYSNGGSAPAPTEEISDLPLPPPPSPTQLQQFQYDNQYSGSSNNNSNNNHSRTHSSLSTQSNSSSTCSSMSPTPTLTTLAVSNSNNNNVVVGNAIEIAFTHNTMNNNNSKIGNNITPSSGSSCSSLSLDRFISSPTHSRQTSSSSSSLSGVGGGGGVGVSVAADNFIGITPSTTPPPPPPPPMPLESEAETMFRNTKNHHNNSNTKMLQQQQQQVLRQHQNENDMNLQNKNAIAAATATASPPATNNVYNKFLKEYSNKLLTQTNNNNSNNNTSNFSPLSKAHNSNSIINNNINSNNNTNINNNATPTNNPSFINNTNNNNKTNFNNNIKIVNGTAKPFVASPAYTSSTPTSSNVAAVSAALANQLKFNPCQIEPSPVVATVETVDTSATSATSAIAASESTTVVNSSSNTSNMFAEEQSIYANTANSTAQSLSGESQPPFEYVTLTGNVIRSVAPPGKSGANKYKVNQGYARPFGATASPAAAAPRSPVSYPPQQQQQQWGGQQQAPKPAVSPYATLPRSNAGQQESPCLKPNNATATLPRKTFNTPSQSAVNFSGSNSNLAMTSSTCQSPVNQQYETAESNNPTAMLTDSIGKINMGDKMNNFMTEAGKIISNMLEARLANNNGGATPLSNSGSTLSLRSNSSSNLSKSPMVVRKRFDLDDFKDVDPTEPVSLKPVVAVQQQVNLSPHGVRLPVKNANQSLTKDLGAHHPMGKVLDICDSRESRDNRSPLLVRKQTNPIAQIGGVQPSAFVAPAAPPPMPITAGAAPASATTKIVSEENNNWEMSKSEPSAPMQTVVLRNAGANNRRASRGGELSTHAYDRRSYIEPTHAPLVIPTQNDANEATPPNNMQNKDGPVFSVSVKALGPNGDENAPMTAENEEVVNQLLKDGKRPICCQCNAEITKGPFITALGRIWCPDHFICVNGNCRRPLQDIGFVEEKGDLYCEYCFEKYLAPTCSKCAGKIKGDCLNAIGKHFHPECFTCGHCGKLFGNTPFFLEEGKAYCEADWNELFTTKCYACGFPVEAGDRWVEALNHNYHSQCFNCTFCKQNLEGQSFYNKGGRPFCKNHAR